MYIALFCRFSLFQFFLLPYLLFAPPQFLSYIYIYIYTFYFIFYIYIFVIVLPLLCTLLKLYVVSFVRVHVMPTSTITLFSWEFIFIIMSNKNLPTECASASRCSGRTSRSRSSRSSRSSHSSHTSKKSTDTLVEVAALKVKLQYIYKEAKQKAELDRVRTEMKLQMAQAKLATLETARDSVDEKSRLAHGVDTNHKVQNFRSPRWSTMSLCWKMLQDHL